MKKLPTILFLLSCFLSTGSQGYVLTFDDITTNLYKNPLNSYGGLTWENSAVMSTALAPPTIGYTGYRNGTVSGDYVFYSNNGNPVTVAGLEFNFIGAYLTAAFKEDLNIDIVGKLDGVQLYSQTITVNTTSATWFEFSFLGINELIFTSYGGTDAGYTYPPGNHIAMDNFTYNFHPVPVPAAVWLLGSGLLGLLGFSKRKKTT
jgi:hypothetical protein